ncbi:SulP family inorganic anion transporter [Streptomyces sp. NPDC001514]
MTRPRRALGEALRRIEPRLASVSPGLARLHGRPAGEWRTDLVAGLTVAAVTVPAAMGMAELAGVPPVVGLYAATLPLLAYAVFGSSRHLVVGPDGALSALVATSVAPLAGGDGGRYLALTSALALLVGCVMFAAALLRLGFMADFLSKPVLLGYLNGVALIIIVGQLGKLLGLDIQAGGFFPTLRELVAELGDIQAATVLLSAGLLAAMVALQRFTPRLPGSLIVVVAAGAASAVLNLQAQGIAVVGAVEGGPPSFGLPHVGSHDLSVLSLPAAGMALLSFGDATAIARGAAARNGYELDSNRELAGLGAANVAAGLMHAMPTSSAGARTAVAEASGGRSQLVGITAGAVVLVVASFATAWIEPLPRVVLGVVVVVAAFGMLNVKGVVRLRKVRDSEAAVAVTAMVAVLALGLLGGLLVAMGLSLGIFVYRSVRPHDAVLGRVRDLDGYHDVARYERAQTVPGLIVYRFDGPLFFPNTPFFLRRVREVVEDSSPDVQWLLLNAEAIVYVDATAVDALRDLHTELADRGITLAMARAKAPLHAVLRRTGLAQQIGTDRFFPTVGSGVAAFLARDEEQGGPSAEPGPD